MVGKERQQEPWVADHTASTDRRKREMNAGAQLMSSFLFSPGPQALGIVPTPRVDLPSSAKTF